MLQHSSHDAICAPAVLGNLPEIAFQSPCEFLDFGPLVVGHGLVQFVQQINGELGEVVDEVERVFSCAMPAVSWPSDAIFSAGPVRNRVWRVIR
jgi:hypothetical protein